MRDDQNRLGPPIVPLVDRDELAIGIVDRPWTVADHVQISGVEDPFVTDRGRVTWFCTPPNRPMS